MLERVGAIQYCVQSGGRAVSVCFERNEQLRGTVDREQWVAQGADKRSDLRG